MLQLDRRTNTERCARPHSTRGRDSLDPEPMSRRTLPLVIVSIAAVACSHAPPRTATVMQQGAPASRPMRYDPTGSINPAELRRDLYIIADDSFRGRETGT